MNGHAPQDALRHPLAAALGVAALLLGACSEPADDGMNAEDAAPAVDTAMVTDHASDAPGEVAANTEASIGDEDAVDGEDADTALDVLLPSDAPAIPDGGVDSPEDSHAPSDALTTPSDGLDLGGDVPLGGGGTGAEDVPIADGDLDTSAAEPEPDTAAPGDVAADASSDDAVALPTSCEGLEDGALCDDSEPCTIEDSCLEESCVGAPMDCSDQDPCTINEICHEGDCKLETLDDGKPCEGANGCPYAGACASGVCEPLEPLCDDGVPCTTDACADEVCLYSNAPNFTSCDDADPCTTFDRCISGTCFGSPKNCKDGEPCTLDSCTPETGDCLSELVDGCVPGTPVDFLAADVNPYSATYESELTLASFTNKLLLIAFHSPS